MRNLISKSKWPGATWAGVFSLAVTSVVLLCGAGYAPVENFTPQGPMQADLNAGGHSVTNAATVSATNIAASGSLTLNGQPVVTTSGTVTSAIYAALATNAASATNASYAVTSGTSTYAATAGASGSYTGPTVGGGSALVTGTYTGSAVQIGRPVTTTVPPNSVVIVLGESRTFYPIYTAGSNGQQTSTVLLGGETWPQWLSGLAAFHNIPVYDYGVAASTCVGTTRMLAGTTSGSGYQDDYFYNGTEYENGSVVGSIAGVSSVPSSHVPSVGSGGIAYFVETHDGGNESGQGISAATYATDELANFATMRGYGSNVKVIGFCGPQSTGYNLGTLYPYATYVRSWLGAATKLDGVVDLSQVFTDPTNGTFYYTDTQHFTSQGYYNVALMVQNAILTIGNPTTPPTTSAWLGQSNIFNAAQSLSIPGSGSQQVLGVYEPGLGTGGNYIYGLFGANSGLDNSLGWSFTYYGSGNLSNQAHFALAGGAPGGLSFYNWGLSATGTLSVAGPVDPAIATATTAGSTSGTVTWSEPFQGSAFKEVVANLSSNFAGTAALVFPAAFTYMPIVINNDVAATTVGTGSIVLTGTGTLPRTVIVEGF